MDALWTLWVIFQVGVGDRRAVTFPFVTLEACQFAGKRIERKGHPQIPGYVVGTDCLGPWDTDLHWQPQRPVRPG